MTDLVDLRFIERRANELAKRLNAPSNLLPTFGDNLAGDGPSVQASDAYYYVVEERGAELNRSRTTDLDELLFWIIEPITSSLAWDYEVQRRRPNEDSRRQAFAKQLELLSMLSRQWAERQRNDLNDILRMHPYHDDLDPQALPPLT